MSKTIVYACDRKNCGKTPAQTTRITSDNGTYKVDLCNEHAKEAVDGGVRQKRRAKRGSYTKKVDTAAVGSTGTAVDGV